MEAADDPNQNSKKINPENSEDFNLHDIYDEEIIEDESAESDFTKPQD